MLVLLHGFTSSSTAWMENLDGLTDHFSVLTVDLLGHGDSDAPDDTAAYRPERAVGRLVSLFDALGIQEALICGHSLGGALALRLALDAPERVTGVVVLNSNSAAGSEVWRDEEQPQLERLAARLRAEGPAILRDTRYDPGRSQRLGDETREALSADFERLRAPGLAGTAEALAAQTGVYERLGDLRVPTLVLVGERDVDFVYNAPRLVAAIRTAKVEVATIHGAGHNAQIEQPDEFNAAVVRFAREIDYLPPLTVTQKWARPALVAAGFLFGWAAIGYGSWLIVSSGDDPPPQPVAAPVAASVAPASATPATAAVQIGTAPASGAASPPAAAPSPTATPTATATAIPTETPAPPTASATPPLQATRAPQDLATPTAVPVRPTSTPTPTPSPTPTEEPTPTPAPPTATPTPSGPRVTISGPSTAAVGAPVTFTASTSGATFVNWDYGIGAKNSVAAISVAFPEARCYTVTATAYFLESATKIVRDSVTVAVGGAVCR